MRIWLVGRPDTVIARYWPIKGEFDPLPALHRWKEDGELLDDAQMRRIGLPVVDKLHQTLKFHAWFPGCPMEEDAYGIPKPKDTEVIVPTLLFVPCVGYTAAASGSATAAASTTARWLSWTRPYTVGLGFASGFLPDLEPEPHDVRSTRCSTSWAWCGRSAELAAPRPGGGCAARALARARAARPGRDAVARAAPAGDVAPGLLSQSPIRAAGPATLDAVLAHTVRLARQHLGLALQFAELRELGIAEGFAAFGADQQARLAASLYDFKRGSGDRARLVEGTRRSLEASGSSLESMLAYAKSHLLRPVASESFQGLAEAVVETQLQRIGQWRDMKGADGRPLIDAAPYNEFNAWLAAAQSAAWPFEVIVTNQLIASVEYDHSHLHASLRGGLSNGLCTQSPQARYGLVSVLSLYPFTSNDVATVALRGGVLAQGDEPALWAAALLVHEIGHQLLHLNHPFGRPALRDEPPPTLRFRIGWPAGCQGLPARQLRRNEAGRRQVHRDPAGHPQPAAARAQLIQIVDRVRVRHLADGLARDLALRHQPFAERLDLRPLRAARADDQPVGHRRIHALLGQRLDQVAVGQALGHQRQPRQHHALAGQRGLHHLVGVVEVEPALGLQLGQPARRTSAATSATPGGSGARRRPRSA
jgi:5-formyltetrahydrofolate cyclo-ligase